MIIFPPGYSEIRRSTSTSEMLFETLSAWLTFTTKQSPTSATFFWTLSLSPTRIFHCNSKPFFPKRIDCPAVTKSLIRHGKREKGEFVWSETWSDCCCPSGRKYLWKYSFCQMYRSVRSSFFRNIYFGHCYFADSGGRSKMRWNWKNVMLVISGNVCPSPTT